MDLKRAAQYAEAGKRLSQYWIIRGMTSRGFPLWDKDEDETCGRLFPDYRAIEKKLKRRTISAIKSRCLVLGLRTRVNKPWTGEEHLKFRRLYSHASSMSEVVTAFPRRSRQAILGRAKTYGLQRPKPPYKPTRDKLLDELRNECHRKNITMPDLDVIAAGRGYFCRQSWRGRRGRIDHGRIVSAIRALGGTLIVQWERDE